MHNLAAAHPDVVRRLSTLREKFLADIEQTNTEVSASEDGS
jgi:hypothetical protein